MDVIFRATHSSLYSMPKSRAKSRVYTPCQKQSFKYTLCVITEETCVTTAFK